MRAPKGLPLLDRRRFLADAGSGIGLLQMLARDGLLTAERPTPFRPVPGYENGNSIDAFT